MNAKALGKIERELEKPCRVFFAWKMPQILKQRGARMNESFEGSEK
jgi:hypothetical protein